MLPIFRIRNGYANLRKNDQIFKKCRKLLSNKESIIMFSEASHHNEYYLQALSKGSSRLVYEAQIESKIPIYIVPVGINYGHHQMPLCDLHIVFGKPILVSDFLNDLRSKAEIINDIREKLVSGMKECIWIPNNDKYYSERKKLINRSNTEMEYTEFKEGLELMNLIKEKKYKNQLILKLIILITYIPNLPPLLILKNILSLFKDKVFYSSIKITAGYILFSLWWIILFVATAVIINWTFALPTLCTSILFLYIRQNLLYLLNK